MSDEEQGIDVEETEAEPYRRDIKFSDPLTFRVKYPNGSVLGRAELLIKQYNEAIGDWEDTGKAILRIADVKFDEKGELVDIAFASYIRWNVKKR